MAELAAKARLELNGVSKSYPAVLANDDVSLCINPGSIHAIMGENGAGKSTLMKIIYGVVKADSGQVLWNGAPARITSPAQARALGIGMVFQHFSLFPALTVLDNLVLSLPAGQPRRTIADTASDLAGRYGLAMELDRVVHSLSVGERQRVEILRCLLQRPQLLIMDEPTSVLTPQAVDDLFGLLRQLAAGGCSIAYISHKLHEVCDLCDAATVLRRGRVVATVDPRKETQTSLARLMIGEVDSLPKRQPASPRGDVRLRICELQRPARGEFATALQDVTLSVTGGEIVGVGGIAGNGQAELLEALSGEWTTPHADMIEIDAKPVGRLGPTARRRLGLAYVPEERLGHGAVPQMPLVKNALLTASRHDYVENGLIRFEAVRRFTQNCIDGFDVRTAAPSTPAQTLSGGNLQKFIVGREMSHDPGVVIVAQPTWGLDVGAASAIRTRFIDMRARGVAILLISEDLDELFEICDRIAIISAGRLSHALPAAETSVEEVGRLMAGQPAEPKTADEAGVQCS